MKELTAGRSFIIDNDFVLKEYQKARKENAKLHSSKSWKYGGVLDEDFMLCYGEDVYRECKLLCASKNARAKRCKKKVEDIVLSGKSWFITLTFNNETLEKTKESTRRILVARALKKESDRYMANIDFGKGTYREHYHAIVWSEERPTFKEWANGNAKGKNKRGFVKVQKIPSSEKDLERVSKYVSKLTNHALKGSTTRRKGVAPRLIYSRDLLSYPPEWLFV